MGTDFEKFKLDAGQAFSRGDYAMASSTWLKALEELDHTDDKDPRVALTLDQLAESLAKENRQIEAIPVLNHCLDLKEKTLGPDHLEVANTLNNLAELYYSVGNFEDAPPLSERIMGIYEKIFGSDHLGLAMISTSLALIYHGQKNFAKAEPFYVRAMSIKQKALGYNHAEVALIMENYAALLYETNRAEEADSLCTGIGTVSGLWKSITAQTSQTLTQGSLQGKLTPWRGKKRT